MMAERHIFENPRQWEEMTPRQEHAVQLTYLEILIYISVICSCTIYTLIRMCAQSKIEYPRAYASPHKHDFLLENLGTLEMIVTATSPGFAAFAVRDDPSGGFVLAIQIVVAIQALLPFLANFKRINCSDWLEGISFIGIPVIVIVLSVLTMVADEDRRQAPFNAYTISIQVFLILITLGKKFCCKWCCKSIREEN